MKSHVTAIVETYLNRKEKLEIQGYNIITTETISMGGRVLLACK